MKHLTRIVDCSVALGCNLLGALEVGALAGIICQMPFEWAGRWLGFLGGLGVLTLVAAFDFIWRYREIDSGEEECTLVLPGFHFILLNRGTTQASWWRFVSPFKGGCICFVPIWLFISLVMIGTLVVAGWKSGGSHSFFPPDRPRAFEVERTPDTKGE